MLRFLVTAAVADNLEHVKVAAFGLALHDAGWLAPENGGRAMPGLIPASSHPACLCDCCAGHFLTSGRRRATR
jgi:hypothetical protein